MQDQSTATSVQAQNHQDSEGGPLWRLQGIFFEPGKTFESIKRRPGFLLPLVLCIVISLAASAAIYSKIDLADIIEGQLRMQRTEMTSEQIDQQVSQVVNSPMYPVMKWASPLVGPAFLVFAVAGLLMLLVYVSGSEAGFKPLLGVTAHTYFLYYLIYSGLTILVFFLAADPQSIDIQNPVYTNLGPLVDQKENPALHRLATSLDVITLYVVYLLGLGLSKVGRRLSLGKGVTLVGILYLIYVVVGIGWRALIG